MCTQVCLNLRMTGRPRDEWTIDLFLADELQELRAELKRTKKEAFATGTSQNLVVQWKSFFLFCVYFQFQPVPATIECVCLFAQFLSCTFKAVTSIQNYISGIRTLHALLEAPFHSTDNIELKLTLRGLKRSKPHAVRQAAPLSPHILCKVHSLLDLTTPFDATLWALLLVAFFTLSRKSNLVVTGKKPFDRRRQLCRSDVLIGEKGPLVQYRWSKTNQFGSRVLLVPVLAIPGSVLCPLEAYTNMLQVTPVEADGPAFVLPINRNLVPVSYQVLQKFIKKCVAKLGLDPGMFSSHSLRRAGATWAFRSQVPGELIKTHGDWSSQAYLRYLEFSLTERCEVAQKMSAEIRREGL